jgi:hypothetical protein
LKSSGIIHSDEKLSNRAKRRGTSQNGKVIIIKHLHFRLLSKNFRKIAVYRLNSLNADIQLIVDGAWESEPAANKNIKSANIARKSLNFKHLKFRLFLQIFDF